VLRVSTITNADELWRLSSDWNRLLGRTRNMLPFLLPEWLSAWWGVFRQDRPLIRDRLRVKVVRRGDEVVGILPFAVTERPGTGPLRARTLGFLGADEFITEQRAPIVDPACEGDVARAVAADLRADVRWDWIAWQGLDKGSELATVLDRELAMRWGRSEVGNVVPLRPTWDEFKGGLKRNIKESLRHCYNSLKREGKTPRMVVAETPADVAKALPTFFSMHGARAQSDLAVTHPDRFAGALPRRFLGDVCARLAARGVTRVFTLEVDGQPVASRVGFVLPDALYLYYSGFDPAWGKYSVMTTAVAEIIKYAIELRLPAVHLSMGTDVSKSRWGGTTPELWEAVCVRPRWTSETALRLYAWGRESLKDHPIRRLLPKRRFD
jgi:CelD/BcsL family acetyltransferase involved in cellulose biosynthesis